MIGEIKHQQEMRPTLSPIVALIEIMVKRGILCHENIMGLDDKAISTEEVSDMWARKLGENRRPNGNTIRAHALKFGLGTKINKNFHHSETLWNNYLDNVLKVSPKQ